MNLKLRFNGLLYLTYFSSFCISACRSCTCFLYLGRTRFESHPEDRHRTAFLCIFDNIFGFLGVTPCSLERTYVRTYMRTYIMHACMHTYIHTYIHTYVHTYVHTSYSEVHCFSHFSNSSILKYKSTCFSLPSLFI